MALMRRNGKKSIKRLIDFMDILAKKNSGLHFSIEIERANLRWVVKLKFINIIMPFRDKTFEFVSKEEEILDKFLLYCVQSIKNKVDLLDLYL